MSPRLDREADLHGLFFCSGFGLALGWGAVGAIGREPVRAIEDGERATAGRGGPRRPVKQPLHAAPRARPQPAKMPLADPQKLASINAAQLVAAMRPDRIRDPGRSYLGRHSICPVKNLTDHALPKPDISCATDIRLTKDLCDEVGPLSMTRKAQC